MGQRETLAREPCGGHPWGEALGGSHGEEQGRAGLGRSLEKLHLLLGSTFFLGPRAKEREGVYIEKVVDQLSRLPCLCSDRACLPTHPPSQDEGLWRTGELAVSGQQASRTA